eukprot:CAMPEP_0170298796 /NCGR_PEP_ID=MMETSP0116_2-20130129/49590_1 /TAXON_ID=400756 /ORGANISM="Durinskia baltica, Strain CSIRO CS-38" /LENGTH=66 /DNA_ID=CAMNT_0010550483 /DNA_START=117 /DNA_END=317 /DNA_ORIENTATION=-
MPSAAARCTACQAASHARAPPRFCCMISKVSSWNSLRGQASTPSVTPAPREQPGTGALCSTGAGEA